MRKSLIAMFLLCLTGCTSFGLHHIHIKGGGTYIYNGVPVTGNADIDTWSCIGSCARFSNLEVVNATNQ